MYGSRENSAVAGPSVIPPVSVDMMPNVTFGWLPKKFLGKIPVSTVFYCAAVSIMRKPSNLTGDRKILAINHDLNRLSIQASYLYYHCAIVLSLALTMLS
jgi:hypothetical protein